MNKENNTWIKLWRKSFDSIQWKNEGLWRLWTYCLLRANYQKSWVTVKTGKGVSEVELLPGQFIYGRKSAAKDLGWNPSTTYKRMMKLKKLEKVDIQSNTHYSIVSIIKWETYQGSKNDEEHRKEHPSNTQGSPKDHPSNTDKKEKKVKKEKKEREGSSISKLNLRKTENSLSPYLNTLVTEFPFLLDLNFFQLFLGHCMEKQTTISERAIKMRLNALKPFGVDWSKKRIETAISSGWKGLIFSDDDPNNPDKANRPQRQEFLTAAEKEAIAIENLTGRKFT